MFAYKYKEKFVMLQSIGIIVIKNRAVIYTSRYSILVDNLIPNFKLYRSNISERSVNICS